MQLKVGKDLQQISEFDPLYWNKDKTHYFRVVMVLIITGLNIYGHNVRGWERLKYFTVQSELMVYAYTILAILELKTRGKSIHSLISRVVFANYFRPQG